MTGLIGMHYGQAVAYKTVNHITDGLHASTIGKIDGDPYLGKATQGSSPHATDDYCLNSCGVQKLHRH